MNKYVFLRLEPKKKLCTINPRAVKIKKWVVSGEADDGKVEAGKEECWGQGGEGGTRWGREGAMISTPTPPWPRPFHLWSRPQLDFLRITRIRKSYGMVFLHQNIWMHTWKRIFFLCISRPLPDYLSFDLCYFLREPSKQWIIKQDNIIVSIPLPIVRVGGGEKAGWD